MKLKPIHWILIATLLIEACILGIWVGRHLGDDTSHPTNTSQLTELPLTYEINEDGSFSLLSMFSSVNKPDINFQYNEQSYSYDISLVELVEAYQKFEKYQAIETDATEALWTEFKEHVSAAVSKRTNQEHAAIEYIRNIAASEYNVPHEQLYNNTGAYTINATTTINHWNTVFSDYLLQDDSGNVPNELALGATVQIDKNDYNALVYTVVNSDGDDKNNNTAPEVSVHILFGDHILSDIALSDATIYYLKPDGSEYFAHSDIKVTYMATGNEARYRDLLILGGLQ